MKIKILIFTLAFAYIFLLQSCDENHCTRHNNPDNILKIGVLLGYSGIGSQNTVETQAALEVYIDELESLRSRTGNNLEIKLIFKDTQSDTNIAKQKATELIKEGVKLIIGPYTSSEVKAVKPIADENKVLLITHSAVSTALAIPDDYVLRFVPSDSYQAEAINAMFQYDSISAIIPVVRNDLWANSLYQATANKFTLNGGFTSNHISYEPNTIDYSSIIASVLENIAQCESKYGLDKIAIYLISYADGTDFLAALSEANLKEQIKIYGASAFAQSTLLLANNKAVRQAYAGNLQCPIFGYDETINKKRDNVQLKIKAKIGRTASIYALAAYDILAVAYNTFLEDDFEEPAKFKQKFISNASFYYGLTGNTELDDNGDRKNVSYDFWSINNSNNQYNWMITALYNTSNKSLKKY